MARGTAQSFIDALQSLAYDIMEIAGGADSDVDFLIGLRDQVHEYIGFKVDSELGGGEPMGADPMGEMSEPVAPAGPPPMSRGPSPGMDMSAMTGDLERALAGTQASGV